MLILVGRRVQGSGRMFSRTYWWEQDGRMRELHSRPFHLGSFVRTLSAHIRICSLMHTCVPLHCFLLQHSFQQAKGQPENGAEPQSITADLERHQVGCFVSLFSYICWSKSSRGSAMMFSRKCLE